MKKLAKKVVNKLKEVSKSNKGFTLLELLVVVLIIGILAGIALPQYKKVVLKSQLSTIKALVNSVANSIQQYYYANDKFPDSYLDLDIELPEGRYWSNNSQYESKDGIICSLDHYQTACNKNRLRYGVVIFAAYNWEIKKFCTVLYEEDDHTTLRHQICREETKNTLDTCSNNWCRYYYK